MSEVIKYYCDECEVEIPHSPALVHYGGTRHYCSKSCYSKTWPTCTKCDAITETLWSNRFCYKCMLETPAGKKWKEKMREMNRDMWDAFLKGTKLAVEKKQGIAE